MEKMKEAYESILIVSCKNGDEAIAEVVGKFKNMIGSRQSCSLS